MSTTEDLRPTVLVIFGGSGDLTSRKLIPAMFDLSQDRGMPENFAIIVVGRSEMGDEPLRAHLYEGVRRFARSSKKEREDWDGFARHISYQHGDLSSPSTYEALHARCEELDLLWDTESQRIFYMATPPSMFAVIPMHLGAAGLANDTSRARIVVEKPVGSDLDSARSLNRVLSANFDESQIFRIDHYLGKETVRNILAFRFANPLFEPIWNRRYVDCVTITTFETTGVEHRGGYYDHAGALRDMVQNHLMQLLCLVAMEPMVSFDADEIRNKKVDVLHAVRPIRPEEVPQRVVRGQYGRGWIDGRNTPGYREEEGVSPSSQTETFAALSLFLDNWRWQGVPFYLRTGKALALQVTEVAIQFREVPHRSFPAESMLDWQPSQLVLSIQPDEGIVLRLLAKRPGPKMHLHSVEMEFNYEDAFSVRSPDAYETLLGDVMKNDATLFMRADQVEAAWRLLTPVFDVWATTPPHDFPNYAVGTFGPDSAQGLLARGHAWPSPTELKSRCRNKAPVRS